MIRINRDTCPEILKNASHESERYRNKKVVKTLWEMQKEKCCYCEQKIPSHGHSKAVEHFKPQSIFTYETNQWENLLLACSQCNGKKSDKFPIMLTEEESETKVIYLKVDEEGEAAIIDPSDSKVNPEEHITFEVDDSSDDLGNILERQHSKLGRTTIVVVGLDGEHYKRERCSYLHTLSIMHWNMINAKNDNNVRRLAASKQQFQQCLDSNSEYAGLARTYARKKKLDKNYGLDIP
jgi:uncharacterized protein (TIGR02646 family)